MLRIMENVERLSELTARYKQAIGVTDASRWIMAMYQAARHGEGETGAAQRFITAAATLPATTTDPAWAGGLMLPAQLKPLVERMQRQTVLARIPGAVQAPLNVPIPYFGGLPLIAWVGQGAPKPVSQAIVGSITLAPTKGAGIVILTSELAQFSIGAESVLSSRLIAASTAFVDQNFLDPALAATADHPASITNGVAAVAAGATIDETIGALVAAFFAARPYALAPVFVMSAAGAATIAGTGNHDQLSTTGGQLVGIPVVIAAGGGNVVALVDASGIYFSDLGAAIDTSRYAAVEANTTPANPPVAATVTHDLWGRDEIGIKLDRFVTWQREPNACAYTVLA
jgi:hypothetical protein